ncbi:hypothetical protein GCM10027275_35500 [Rhabdobacter roseus]|uniref:LTD domain-containing protein n=1 Tax=Rhabdobacter roseus TaxID=1655419 RepID=A0A840TU82_9BACT|nr:CotH kinase family protein [Rhabdobacter roseus]MBB5285227.1 hypothetical protein [Rhabdobacter roseus]
MRKFSWIICVWAWLVVGSASAQDVRINELLASNSSTITDATGDYADWVELRNTTGSAVSLANYYITDNLSNLTKYQLPAGVTVPANGYLILWASGMASRGNTHLGFSLSADGESLALVNPDGQTIVDQVTFGPQRANVSWGRKPDVTGDWYFLTQPSPGASNNASPAYSAILDPPTFSQAGGFFTSPFELSLGVSDPEVTIYYTLDGSEPSPNNVTAQSYTYKNSYPQNAGHPFGPLLTRYFQSYSFTAPLPIQDRTGEPNQVSSISSTWHRDPFYIPSFPVDKGTVVRAAAYKEGALPSQIVTHSYFFTPTGTNKYTFPILSLTIPERSLFDYQTGIYTAGRRFDQERENNPSFNAAPCNLANYSNSGSAWEREGNAELFVGTSAAFNQPVGVRIHGGCSRFSQIKSLRLYSGGNFNYPIFSDYPSLIHRNLLARNSGQDWNLTLFRDAFLHKMVQHLHFDTQASQPSIVFMNGEYWGIHNLRERHDNHYVERVYGVDGDNLDMYQFNWNTPPELEEGTSAAYNAFSAFIQNNTFADAAKYDSVRNWIDMNNFIDYQATQIYAANTDWPHNNVRIWRLRVPYQPNAPRGHDGRWRWMLFDTDFGLGQAQPISHNTLEHATANNESTRVLRRMLDNTTFRTDFISRFTDLLNSTFLPARTVPMLEQTKQLYAPEMEAHITRWANIPNFATWEASVDVIKSFLEQRAGHVRNHLRSRFNLGQDRNVVINVSNPAQGYVRVNTIDLLPTTEGVSSQPYPWSGQYFQQASLTLRARAQVGYRFKHWQEGVNIASSDSVYVLSLAASDRSLTAVFEVDPAFTAEPPAYDLSACTYEFMGWPADTTAGTFPSNMAFVYMDAPDPTLGAQIAGFTSGLYNYGTRSRVNGLDAEGISFVNTTSNDANNINEGYPMGRMGGALLALNTLGQSDVSVSWVGGTVEANNRTYALRLQYRVGDNGPFTDLLDGQGQAVEYVRNATSGHSETLGPVQLPAAALDQPYVQLFWRYYQKETGSGSRARLRLDDIVVSRGGCESIASGDWQNASTWSCGRVPSVCDAVLIHEGHVVRLEGTGLARQVQVADDAQLELDEDAQLQLGEN